MESKFALHPTYLKFIYRHKAAVIPLFILFNLLGVAVLNYFTTYTYVYTPEIPTETIIPKPDAVLLSFHISIAELQNIPSLTSQTLIAESNNSRTVEALRDCEFLFKVAVSQLNESINLLTEGSGDYQVYTASKILSLNLLIKAAIAAQERCLDGLEKMGSTVLDEVRVKMQRSKQCTSNSLATLAKLYPLDKFTFTFRASKLRTCLFNRICVTRNM